MWLSGRRHVQYCPLGSTSAWRGLDDVGVLTRALQMRFVCAVCQHCQRLRQPILADCLRFWCKLKPALWRVFVQLGALQIKLSEVWASLTGQACAFEAAAPDPELLVDDACFSLPITEGLTGYASHVRARVLLRLGRRELGLLASAMFGRPCVELQPADEQDAGMELCNILSACLLDCLGDTSLAHLGLPQVLDASSWQQLYQGTPALVQFVAADPRQRMAVIMIEFPAETGDACQIDLQQPGSSSSE